MTRLTHLSRFAHLFLAIAALALGLALAMPSAEAADKVKKVYRDYAAMGVLASLIWDRALMLPLERPKSVTTDWVNVEMDKGH